MKIQRYNEASNNKLTSISIDVEGIWKNVLNTRNNIKSTITDFIENNGDIIKFDNSIWIRDPDEVQHAPDIYGISNEGFVFASREFDPEDTEGEPMIYIMDIEITEDLIEILNAIKDNYQYTYEYQKKVIDNMPNKIHTIKKLNARIKKEYPHLGQGKDLNLL